MSHQEAAFVDHGRLRGSWAERATERLRVSGERTASLRSSINSAREHLAAYQATDSAYVRNPQTPSSASQSPKSAFSLQPSPPPFCCPNLPPGGHWMQSRGTSPAPTESPQGSPLPPGNSKVEQQGPCSPTTEQLISQSAMLHRTMQEQAAQLRAQQDKLTTLSQRVLAHKGDSPSRPTSSSHLSPAPPQERDHAQQALPSNGQHHERDALRSSAASLPSSSLFTVRSSSRSVRDSHAASAEGLRASRLVQNTQQAHRMQSPVDATADRMASLRFAEIQNMGSSQNAAQNLQSVPASEAGPSQYLSGSLGASAGFHVRNMSSTHAPAAAAAAPASVASPYVMHTDHAHMLGNPATRAHSATMFTNNQKQSASHHDANCFHTHPDQHQHCHVVHDSRQPDTEAPPGYSTTHNHNMRTFHTHTSHPTGPASYTADASKGSSPQLHPGAGAAPMAPWPQTFPPAAPLQYRSAHAASRAPISSKPSDVQSAVSELLQTLSETRQRHAAAVQNMNGAYYTNYGASTIIPEQVNPPTGYAASQPSAQSPSLERESSGLRAVQHPVVQSVINQLVSSIATHATAHSQKSPVKDPDGGTRSNNGDPASVPNQSVARASNLQPATQNSFPETSTVPGSRCENSTGWKSSYRPPGAKLIPGDSQPEGDVCTAAHEKHSVHKSKPQEKRGNLGDRNRAGERAKLDEYMAQKMDPGRRNFLSVRDLKPAEGDTFTDEYDTDAPPEHIHGDHAWENADGCQRRFQGSRTAPATEEAQRGDFRSGKGGNGGVKRGVGAAQRKKSGWDSTVGVPWSEAEAKGKGGRRIPPIGGYGSGYGGDRTAHANMNPHPSSNTDPLKLFKASAKGVGVPMRGQAHMHDGHASTLGKRSRERRGGGITDVPAKARPARTALGHVHGKPASSRAPKSSAEFTVRKTGGGRAPPGRGSLRKGKGGWSLKRQTSEGDFAGDPILEGESTVLSAGEEDSACEPSDRDSDFGEDHDDQNGYSDDDAHQTNGRYEHGRDDNGFRSPCEGGDPSQTIWEEHEAVRAAAHSLHAHGSAPTVDDAVGILEAQLREAVQAAKADSREQSQRDGRAHASGASEASSSPGNTNTTQSSSGSDNSRSCHCSDTPSDSRREQFPTHGPTCSAQAPSEPPPPAWRRLEELEARVDSLVSRMQAPHASLRPHAPRKHRAPSHGRRHASAARSASPNRVGMHCTERDILNRISKPSHTNACNTGMHERTHTRGSKPPGSRSVSPCKNLPQGSGITAETLAEKLADIELAESTIFNRWFTPDGQPRSSPLPLPLGTSSNSKVNIQSADVAPVDTSHAAHTAAPQVHSASAQDVRKSHMSSARMHANMYTGQENEKTVESSPVRHRAEPSYVQHKAQNSAAPNKSRTDVHEAHGVNREVQDFRDSPAVPASDEGVQEPKSLHDGDTMHARHASQTVNVSGNEETAAGEHHYEGLGLGAVDTFASAYTACTSNTADAWAGPGGQTSRNILRRTPLCMHGPRDVCAHCIANTPRPPSYTPREPRESEGGQRGGQHDDASDGCQQIRAFHMHGMHVTPAEALRRSVATEWFSRSEVDDIIASRDECAARRAQDEVEYLLKGGCDLETVNTHAERDRLAQQSMPGMHRSAFVSAVELMAESVIEAVVDDQVDAMLCAVDSAAARLVVEECADQYAENPPKRANPNRDVEFVGS